MPDPSELLSMPGQRLLETKFNKGSTRGYGQGVALTGFCFRVQSSRVALQIEESLCRVR